MSEKHQFTAEVSKILQLMIHSLYTNRDIFLRELISNASDACDKLRYDAQINADILKEGGDFHITITPDKVAQTLTIEDNGIGMSRQEMIDHLGTIARSGTHEFARQLSGNNKKDANLIGQFGVGFYSAFMVANKVEVYSRRAGETEGNCWESKADGEYTISETNGAPARGTRIVLYLKEDAKEFADFFRLKHIIQTYSDHIAFPIQLTSEEGKQEVVNSSSALWARPKQDITEDQYKEFYRHVSHQPDDPYLRIHHKAEGTVEYTALLFIPGIRPFDLFHPDRARRVKLYVKRVFITDEGVDLIPQWLRFLRGIIDSEDLPLNISRETLQANPVLTKIREAVTRKVLQDLNKRAAEDKTGYAEFWENYGGVMKEGLCEPDSTKDLLLDACRFYSTHGEDLVSLDEYVSRMKDGQPCIYYLTGERLASLRADPKLEGFRKRGIEVLLFTDAVDDFWVNVVHHYKEKELKSITRADIDLSHIKSETEDESQKRPEPVEGIEPLIARMKDILGDEVQDIRTTDKLIESAACLAVQSGAMDIRLERFLRENKQLPHGTAKILEINPTHPIIAKLVDELKSGSADIEDITRLLLDQARIVEGEPIEDPAAFNRRLNQFLARALAA